MGAFVAGRSKKFHSKGREHHLLISYSRDRHTCVNSSSKRTVGDPFDWSSRDHWCLFVCLFVCLSVWGLSSHSRVFHSYDEGLQILT